MEYRCKKAIIYFENAFTLFLTESIDNLKTTTNTATEKLRKFRIAARFTAHVIKAGFKFYFIHDCERTERDKSFQEFCDELYKTLDKGL
jgi:hypothetical protein